MKYDFKLDLNKNNSLSIILSRIKKHSSVLEFGCANGRLTRYLAEEMNCKVTVVEIEEEAGKDAKPFSVDALLGEQAGDIENFEWCNHLAGKTFDYIVFADVLEHLRDPERVLKECKAFLSDIGSILVSIPNIANNSIIIDLLQNEFQYHNIGLLDNTHIKFYTCNSFNRMVERLDYKMIFESGTYTKIGDNEFHVNYQQLSPYLKHILLDRPLGDIYQYVFQFENVSYENNNKELVKMYPSTKELYYQSVVYYMEDGVSNESRTVRKGVSLGINEFEFVMGEKGEFRFDPINTSAIIKNIEVTDQQGNIVDIKSHNAEIVENNSFYFINSDPFFILSLTSEHVDRVKIRFEIVDFELSSAFMEYLMGIKNAYNQLNKKYHDILSFAEEQNNILIKNNEHIDNLNNIIKTLNAEIENLRLNIEELHNSLNEKDDSLNKKDNSLNEKDNIINNLIAEQTFLNAKIHDYENRVEAYNRKKYHIFKV